MTTKPKTPATDVEIVIETASQITAPILGRVDHHREKVSLIVKELEGERYTVLSQRETLTRAFEAAIKGLDMHLADIDAATDLYLRGLNGLPADGSKGIE